MRCKMRLTPLCDFVGKSYDRQNNLRFGTERFKEFDYCGYIVIQVLNSYLLTITENFAFWAQGLLHY